MPRWTLLLLLLLLLLLPAVLGGPPRRSDDAPDLAAAGVASAARLLRTSTGGQKRHVTRPLARPRLSPVGDPANHTATLKVIRRRKVLPPGARLRDADASGDDVSTATERSFREFLRPPFLALLNDSHFSLQPEFLLAQGGAGEHRMQPFRDFGEKLEQGGARPAAGDLSGAGSADVAGGAGGAGDAAVEVVAVDVLDGDPGERHGKVIVRRKKVRVVKPGGAVGARGRERRPKESASASAEPPPGAGPDHNATSESPSRLKGSASNGTTTAPEATTATPPVTTPTQAEAASSSTASTTTAAASGRTTKRRSTRAPTRTFTTSSTARADSSAPSKAENSTRPGAGAKPTVPPSGENLEPDGTSNKTQPAGVSGQVRSGPASARRPRPNLASKVPRSRKPEPAAGAARGPAARLRSSLSGRRRRTRLRGRLSRPRQNATAAAPAPAAAAADADSTDDSDGVTTEPTPVNREKKEVAKVLGLLGKIRNRARTRPSFLPSRGRAKGTTASLETPAAAATSATPATPATPARATSEAASASTTTDAEVASTASPAELSTPPSSTTARSTLTSSTTTRSASPPSTTARPTPRSLATTPSTTTPSATSEQPLPSPTVAGVTATDGDSESPHAPPPPTTDPAAEAAAVERQKRLDTRRRALAAAGSDKPNLLARRLQERRNIFSIRGGRTAKADASPLLPTITPFPILLSTLKSALRPGLRGAPFVRNFTVSVTLPPPASPGAAEAAPAGSVPRKVLGTSLETSVSIAVSPLEFRLRKRVMLPKAAGERPAAAEVLESLGAGEPPAETEAGPPGPGSPGSEESSAGERSPASATKEKEPADAAAPLGGRREGAAQRVRQRPVLESSVLESTERPPPAEVEDSFTGPRTTRIPSGEKNSAPKAKEEKPPSPKDLMEKDGGVPARNTSVSSGEPGDAETQQSQNGDRVLPSAAEEDPSYRAPSGNRPPVQVSGEEHAVEDHTYLRGFLMSSDASSATEDSAGRPSGANGTTEQPPAGGQSSSEGDIARFTAGPDSGEPAASAGGDVDDPLTAAPSTTAATMVRPTDAVMQRILAAEAPMSSASSTASSSAAPSTPVSTTTSTTSSSMSSQTSSSFATAVPAPESTPRQATVQEVPSVRVKAADELGVAEDEKEGGDGPIYLVSLLFVLPVVAVAIWYLKKNHPDVQQLMPERLKTMLAQETSDGARENFYPVEVDETSRKSTASQAHDTLARRRRWEHPRETLRLQSILGEGHFGQVWRAEADNIGGHQGTLLVAVKNVKENSTAKEKQDLLRELRIMQDLGSHPNVVTLLGCCTAEDPVLVIMEYMVFGKLLTYLRENRGRHNYYNFSHDSAVLTSPDLTLFAYQIATGMEYIANKGIIHRDLAARNILVDHTKVCKVSDFGMSRSIKEISSEVFEPKHRGALPIRWMSPESLYHNTFNQQTDCWSFGILLWEIITLGSTPYPGLSAREVMRSVREGYRLERPDHCHPQLYQLASSCWAAEPSWRPTFAELQHELEVLLEDQNQGYVDLDKFQEEIYGTLNKSSDEKV